MQGWDFREVLYPNVSGDLEMSPKGGFVTATPAEASLPCICDMTEITSEAGDLNQLCSLHSVTNCEDLPVPQTWCGLQHEKCCSNMCSC